jgi:hypothetical protein
MNPKLLELLSTDDIGFYISTTSAESTQIILNAIAAKIKSAVLLCNCHSVVFGSCKNTIRNKEIFNAFAEEFKNIMTHDFVVCSIFDDHCTDVKSTPTKQKNGNLNQMRLQFPEFKEKVEDMIYAELMAWKRGEKQWGFSNQHDEQILESALENLNEGSLYDAYTYFGGGKEGAIISSVMTIANYLSEFQPAGYCDRNID